jgi:hypothetical protein
MERLKQPGLTHFILLMVFFFISCFNDMSAQKQEVDAVYLKNGEIYRGSLQNHPEKNQIKLQTLCWNTMLFDAGDVDHIDREMVNVKSSRLHVPSSGYFNQTDLGVLIGTGNNEKNAIFSAQMVNGYKIRSRYYPGLGYMYALGLGTFVRLNGHNSLSISLTYRFQSLRSVITQDWTDEVLNLNKQYNRIAFRIGLVFE